MALQSHSEEVKVAYFHVFIHHIIYTVAVATVIRRRSDASPVAYIPSETAEKPQHFQPPAATRVSVEQKMQINPHCRPKARSKTVRKSLGAVRLLLPTESILKITIRRVPPCPEISVLRHGKAQDVNKSPLDVHSFPSTPN